MESWTNCGRPALAPGFPGPDLRQAAGAKLIENVSPKPYEIKLSGFLTALERHGDLTEKNQIGVIGVISDNFDIPLKKKSTPACFQDLISFWKFFLGKLQ